MRKMALTVPADSTALIARSRQLGNWSSANSRTTLCETLNWPACMFTPAASRAPALGCNRLSVHARDRVTARNGPRQAVLGV